MVAHTGTNAFRLPALAAAIVAAGGAATLAGAWFFQLVVGLAPCPLCLEQRIPYYAAVPVALLALLLARRGSPLARWVLLLAGLLMVVGAALALYHTGVEWKWWQGPTECSGAGPVQSTNILLDMQKARVVRCDEAPWRLFGVSLAGYNVLIATTLALVALSGVVARGHGSSSVSQ
ncbi:disulfide bond formation protein B [Ancylobacter lacus]|uniref:disulfide bond formation protein B n=1 Tax=Ancylobacter lacus TaxID=2579970 RepID=UPI001BD03506|nr:disulfide bond formation protein B [Ancylobacter lacus]MBS7537907.1 disulfide bond formation protein B [Ancylobacter lacus]